MLPVPNRLRHRADFAAVMRQGRRVNAGLMIVYAADIPATTPRAGFVVARSVGTATVRNRVRRRLQELVAGRLGGWPETTSLVVRALPPAATASFDQLARGLDQALERLLPTVNQS